MGFSDKVKQVRIKLELSQKALAEKWGVTHATISRRGNNNRIPKIIHLDMLEAFCKANGIVFNEKKERLQ